MQLFENCSRYVSYFLTRFDEVVEFAENERVGCTPRPVPREVDVRGDFVVFPDFAYRDTGNGEVKLLLVSHVSGVGVGVDVRDGVECLP